ADLQLEQKGIRACPPWMSKGVLHFGQRMTLSAPVLTGKDYHPLLLEHRHLPQIFFAATSLRLAADHREHGQLSQGIARYKDALCVGARVGWVHEEAIGCDLGEIV